MPGEQNQYRDSGTEMNRIYAYMQVKHEHIYTNITKATHGDKEKDAGREGRSLRNE